MDRVTNTDLHKTRSLVVQQRQTTVAPINLPKDQFCNQEVVGQKKKKKNEGLNFLLTLMSLNATSQKAHSSTQRPLQASVADRPFFVFWSTAARPAALTQVRKLCLYFIPHLTAAVRR